jgi:hypothetical protein
MELAEVGDGVVGVGAKGALGALGAVGSIKEKGADG